jgi:DNA-binding transcriptional MerR regulator
MDDGDPQRLPAIPAKRYFTIGEVSELCGVKPYVLRYWEQEFTQLRPMKRRGNRRYYQHHEVLLIRRIRDLLYDQGFTISGARNRLADHGAPADPDASLAGNEAGLPATEDQAAAAAAQAPFAAEPAETPAASAAPVASHALLTTGALEEIRAELFAIRNLLRDEPIRRL